VTGTTRPLVAGLILAGGRGSRMAAAAPKPLLRLGERTLIEHVLARLTSGIAPVLLSANDAEAFAGFGLPVVQDRIGGYAGPLAGLDAAAAYLAKRHPALTHLLMLPGDTPFLPRDLAARMLEAPNGRARVARHAGALQPTVTLWPTAALAALPGFLATAEKHSILGFLDLIGLVPVDFDRDARAPGGDPFFNVNTPADLALARAFDTHR
jgi:molybdopterin-guanine dinucleotide biosynthesis protein A